MGTLDERLRGLLAQITELEALTPQLQRRLGWGDARTTSEMIEKLYKELQPEVNPARLDQFQDAFNSARVKLAAEELVIRCRLSMDDLRREQRRRLHVPRAALGAALMTSALDAAEAAYGHAHAETERAQASLAELLRLRATSSKATFTV